MGDALPDPRISHQRAFFKPFRKCGNAAPPVILRVARRFAWSGELAGGGKGGRRPEKCTFPKAEETLSFLLIYQLFDIKSSIFSRKCELVFSSGKVHFIRANCTLRGLVRAGSFRGSCKRYIFMTSRWTGRLKARHHYNLSQPRASFNGSGTATAHRSSEAHKQ